MLLWYHFLFSLVTFLTLNAVQNRLADHPVCSKVKICLDFPEVKNKMTNVVKDILQSQIIEHKFHRSAVYSGSRYYLRKTTTSDFSLTSAEQTCRGVGGNLAEMNNPEELQFVQSFLRRQTVTCAYISGSDDKQEGNWVNPFRNTALTIKKWGSGEPNGGRSEDCLGLWQRYDYLMGDAPCSGVHNGTSFLCESTQ